MDDAAQAFLKTKIMDNIQKYFYLICFTAYLREQSKSAKDGISEEEAKTFALSGGKGTIPDFIKKIYFKLTLQYFFTVSFPTENLKINKDYVVWMDEHANLRTICEQGKGK
jgi:hypothetical protein